MNNHPESFDHMLAAWNERDPNLIRAHLDQALAADIEFIDPTIVTRGIAEFEQNVRSFRLKYPDAQLALSSAWIPITTCIATIGKSSSAATSYYEALT